MCSAVPERENCSNWRPHSWKNLALGQELPWQVLHAFVFAEFFGFLGSLGVFFVVLGLFFKYRPSRIHQFRWNSLLQEIKELRVCLGGNQHIPCTTLFSQKPGPQLPGWTPGCCPHQINFALDLLRFRAEKKKKFFLLALHFLTQLFAATADTNLPLWDHSKGFWQLRNLLDSFHLQDFPNFLPISIILPGHAQTPPSSFCCPSLNPIQEVKAVIISYHPLLKFCHDYSRAKASQSTNLAADLGSV